jgi:phosphoglycerate kinase
MEMRPVAGAAVPEAARKCGRCTYALLGVWWLARAFGKKTVRDVPLEGRTVLVRVDFNVPMRGTHVVDDTRIVASLPTIRHLCDHQARVLLCSHLGRPGGKRAANLSLRPLVPVLQEALGREVAFSPDPIGPRARRIAADLPPGGVALLENTRFYGEEERNDPVFARALGALADLFVEDAFGAVHRAHASTVGVAEVLPAVAGLLLEREITALSRLQDAERPFAAVIGGAKVSDKLGVLEHLLGQVDHLLVGGGMANTFLAAMGYDMGRSLVERDRLEDAKHLIATATERGVDLVLPVDLVVGDFFLEQADHQVVQVQQVPENWLAMDIGPLTAERFGGILRGARTVFWNGPLGVTEWPNFAQGTAEVARAVAAGGGFRVVGGGDSIAALRKLGLTGSVDHLSTGGGAALEFLEGRVLPGVACLEDR